jgi:predicted acylesterase/phospholipase RssA
MASHPGPRAARSAALAALAAAALAAAPRAGAAEAPPRAVSLTIRGGVSLGAHEAGLTLAALSFLRDDAHVPLRIVTGASAGSLNALLAVLESCGEGADAPERSMLWRTWIPMGFDRLSVPGGASALGAFSREALLEGAARIEAAWRAGLPGSCDLVLGIAATRTEARRAHMAGGVVELPSMEDKFAVRIQGRGAGRPPKATNYAARTGAERLLATDAAGEIAFEAIRDLVVASMSVPVAFTPYPLATCDARTATVPGACPAAEASVSSYVDGAIFDTAPIRFAVTIARTGLEAGPGRALAFRAERLRSRPAVPEGVLFAFLDPEVTDYPSLAEAAGRGAPAITTALQDLAAGFIDSARAKELTVLLEEDPEIADRVLVPRRHFPAASAPLYAFLGFFETEFRIFDFTLGMYDGLRALEMHPGGRPRRQGPLDAWPRLACMRAVYDGLPGAEAACGGEALADFRALLQVSLDQLYDRCAKPGAIAARRPVRNPHCDRAARGEPPPHVPGLAPAHRPERAQRKDETDLAWSMRLLGGYGFRFADLGVPPGRGDLAVDRIRSRIGSAGAELARAQPWRDRTPVALAAKVAADTLSYAPPARVLHLATGPTATELGLSVGTAESTWLPRTLRVAGAAGVRGLAEMLSSDAHPALAFSLTAGVEVQPPLPWILAQLRLGLRAGWLLARDDRYGEGQCGDEGRARVSACSRPVVQVLASTSLLERLRLQVVGEWYPATRTRSELWSVAPGLGLEWGF